MTYRTAALCCGGCLIVLSFICLLVAIVTNNWIIVQVNSGALNLDSNDYGLALYNRNRGLFKECFKNREDTRSYVRANPLVDDAGECLRNELALQRDISYDAKYRTRSALQVAMVVFFCLALLLCVCGFGVFCHSAYLRMDASQKWSLSTKWSGILIFIAAFCNALGMAIFHGAEFMETQRVTEESPNQAPYLYYFTLAQPTALQNATTRSYSWSYALSWLAVFFEVMAALCLFLCGACCGPKRKSDKEYFDFNTLNSSRSHGQRNLAYEYVEGKQPVALYEPNGPQMISDGVYHDHFQGRYFDPYNKGPAVVQETRPQYNYDEGGWSWQ